MPEELSHRDCMQLLADPSTQNVLEKLGYEYSNRGLAEYRKARTSILSMLVRAIVTELELHLVFPPQYRTRLDGCGVLAICKQDAEFVLVEIDKPSVRDEHVFSTSEDAARAYVEKTIDSYWLKADVIDDPPSMSARQS